MNEPYIHNFDTPNDFFLVNCKHPNFLPEPVVSKHKLQYNVNSELFVPLPFYNLGKNLFWELVTLALTEIKEAKVLSINNLILLMQSYCMETLDTFALEAVLAKGIYVDKKLVNIMNVIIPGMAELALQIPVLITQPIPLLKQNTTSSLTLSQHQVACILANAFFCTFPEPCRNNRMSKKLNYINFKVLFGKYSSKNIEKLKCIFYYFYQVLQKMPLGAISIMRNTTSSKPWAEIECEVGDLKAHSFGVIEEQNNMIHVDFANMYIGGGVLSSGCVQEEIRFLTCPEMIVSCLVCEKMGVSESIHIIGAETYSNYIGYANTFRWKYRNRVESLPRDELGRYSCEVLAIDAVPFKSFVSQFSLKAIERDLHKAYAGFSVRTKHSENWPIATGNWGCGAFNGNLQLKAVIQLIAAASSSRRLEYFVFNEIRFGAKLNELVEIFRNNKITVGILYRLTIQYSIFKLYKQCTLFNYLKETVQNGAENYLENLESLKKNAKMNAFNKRKFKTFK